MTPPGNSHKPGQTSSGLRFWIRTLPLCNSTPVAMFIRMAFLDFGKTGRMSTVPTSKAAHSLLTGQSAHFGFLEHTNAPSSISAWLKSPGRFSGIRLSTWDVTTARVPLSRTDDSISNSRAKTLKTLASTAGSDLEKAMLEMAPAV